MAASHPCVRRPYLSALEHGRRGAPEQRPRATSDLRAVRPDLGCRRRTVPQLARLSRPRVRVEHRRASPPSRRRWPTVSPRPSIFCRPRRSPRCMPPWMPRRLDQPKPRLRRPAGRGRGEERPLLCPGPTKGRKPLETMTSCYAVGSTLMLSATDSMVRGTEAPRESWFSGPLPLVGSRGKAAGRRLLSRFSGSVRARRPSAAAPSPRFPRSSAGSHR